MKMMNYAKALHQIAVEKNILDVINHQFESFCEDIKKDPSWILLMDSPMLSIDDKYQNIDALGYEVSFLSFLKVLAKNRELNLYQEIYDQWVYLARAHQKIAHIGLYSAKPISDETIEKFRKALQPRFEDKTIEFHVVIDETLIGGVKTVYQGQSLDRSVAKELEELYTII